MAALEAPDEALEHVNKLASTTFVETVDLQTLSVISPILIEGFRSQVTEWEEVQRGRQEEGCCDRVLLCLLSFLHTIRRQRLQEAVLGSLRI